MKFIRRTAEYRLLGHRRNDIFEELKEFPMEKELAHHKQKCLNHVNRMEGIRYPKQILDYRTIGRRRRRRRRRRSPG
jgi:hypothetical protein